MISKKKMPSIFFKQFWKYMIISKLLWINTEITCASNNISIHNSLKCIFMKNMILILKPITNQGIFILLYIIKFLKINKWAVIKEKAKNTQRSVLK